LESEAKLTFLKINTMATKRKGKPERFIRKSKTGAMVVFTQVSKHYLTCETSTESTNRPRQI